MTTTHPGASYAMKAFHPTFSFAAAALLLAGLLPAPAMAGPDDVPRTGRTVRPAPPDVTVQRTTTAAARDEEDDRPIQPLRQREESVHFRIAYKLLNEIGFTGTEGDRRPIGYLQIYGPPPMLVYQRAPAPQPRRFPHFAASTAEAKPAVRAQAAQDKAEAAPDTEPTPAASPAPKTAATAEPPPEGPEPGILPDPTQQTTAGRNNEILTYFQRPNSAGRRPLSSAAPGGGMVPANTGEDPGYLQGPEQQPLPPSRATYRVVPQ